MRAQSRIYCETPQDLQALVFHKKEADLNPSRSSNPLQIFEKKRLSSKRGSGGETFFLQKEGFSPRKPFFPVLLTRRFATGRRA